MEATNKDKKYSYADLKNFEQKEGEHWELIDGVPYLFARPSQKHQDILRNLLIQFSQELKTKKCIARIESEVNLSFTEDESKIDRLVVPDLYVTCNQKKSDGQKLNGTPDLIVEILSTNRRHDKFVKYQLYQKSGVKEYWIIDPLDDSVEVYSLHENGMYSKQEVYEKKDKIGLHSLDLSIDLNEVFDV